MSALALRQHFSFDTHVNQSLHPRPPQKGRDLIKEFSEIFASKFKCLPPGSVLVPWCGDRKLNLLSNALKDLVKQKETLVRPQFSN